MLICTYALDSAFQGRTYQSVSCMPVGTSAYELISQLPGLYLFLAKKLYQLKEGHRLWKKY